MNTAAAAVGVAEFNGTVLPQGSERSKHCAFGTDELAIIKAVAQERLGVKILHGHQLEALSLLLQGSTVVQKVQTGGGKTAVAILFALLRKHHPVLFEGRALVVGFAPTLSLVVNMVARFRNAGLEVWCPSPQVY